APRGDSGAGRAFFAEYRIFSLPLNPRRPTEPRRESMARSKVAVLKVDPANVLDSIERLCDLAGMKQVLDPGATTILKDNISWHFPFPGANTTPWQLEGTIRALRNSGYEKLACVQNKTVVT